MLDTLILILTLLLKAASLWFLAVALFALRKPLVESLKKQDYPDALYDIFVIPNNCTDDTESEALCAGAKIFRCFEPVRCKGDALHEAVAWLLPQRYDAFCVFDADNVADEQFLARMNDAFCAGAQVCKGAMRAKNPYASWLSGCYGLYFTLFDTFFSRARMSCGLSSKLVGTGFAVHRAVLERFGGWNTSTIAEDAELAAQCAANGVRVCFVPGALTSDEAPNDFDVSLRQRRRWCSGIMDVAVRMDAPLVSALRGSAPLRALDALLIVNDDPRLAKAIGADGVHLGQNDTPPDEARIILGRQAIIGCTANTFAHIARIAQSSADYIGLGPFRYTTTKKNLSPILGEEGYRRILRQMARAGIRLPVAAIGGITEEDVPQVMACGVNGIALSGAISRAGDIAAATARFTELVAAHRTIVTP